MVNSILLERSFFTIKMARIILLFYHFVLEYLNWIRLLKGHILWCCIDFNCISCESYFDIAQFLVYENERFSICDIFTIKNNFFNKKYLACKITPLASFCGWWVLMIFYVNSL